MEQLSTANMRVRKITNTVMIDTIDQLAVEEPLEISLDYYVTESRSQKTISVTMRTPGNDRELAAGFLFTEGIIRNKAEIMSIEQEAFDENRVLVKLQDKTELRLQKTERNFYTTSSCGVCGKTSIDAIKTVSIYNAKEDSISLKADLFYAMHDSVRSRQSVFDSTGGIHAAALLDLGGNLIQLLEDVGRHNALDKLIGTALLNGELPLSNHILLLSGRASFELVQKACMAGIKVIAAVGAPSSLAVQLAKECDITLIGFLRKERFNIYSGERRIKL